MKKIIFPFILLFFFNFLSAQADWTKGQITTLSGSVLEGEIYRQAWNDAITELEFRDGLSGVGKKYALSSLSSFSLDGTYFLVDDVTVNTSSRDRSSLVKVEEKTQKSFRGILKRVAGGSVELYELITRDNQNHYFISRNSQTPEYLGFGRYYRINENRDRFIYEQNEYWAQLNKYFVDCQGLTQDIAASSYTRQSLGKLFSRYYECIGEEEVKSKSSLIFRAGLFAVVGTPKSNFQIFKNYPSGRAGQTFPSGPYFSGGIFGRLYFTPEQKVAIRGELRFNRLNHTESVLRNASTSTTLEIFDEQDFEEQSVLFRLGGEFVFINAQKPLLFTAGIMMDFSLKSNFEKREVISVDGVITSSTLFRSGNPIYSGQTLIGPDAGLLWRLGILDLSVTYSYFSLKDEFNIRAPGGRFLLKAYYEF